MNKTTLSPIIAGTMNWEFGIKPNIEGNAKHDSCLLRKQNYHLDHADIYGSYTTEGAFGKAFASVK
jgi:predicted oxidoreductase